MALSVVIEIVYLPKNTGILVVFGGIRVTGVETSYYRVLASLVPGMNQIQQAEVEDTVPSAELLLRLP